MSDFIFEEVPENGTVKDPNLEGNKDSATDPGNPGGGGSSTGNTRLNWNQIMGLEGLYYNGYIYYESSPRGNGSWKYSITLTGKMNLTFKGKNLDGSDFSQNYGFGAKGNKTYQTSNGDLLYFKSEEEGYIYFKPVGASDYIKFSLQKK